MIHVQALPGRQTTTFEIENTMAKLVSCCIWKTYTALSERETFDIYHIVYYCQ